MHTLTTAILLVKTSEKCPYSRPDTKGKGVGEGTIRLRLSSPGSALGTGSI
jgi:hypothetical protein